MNITIITILLPYPLDSGGTQAQYNMIDTIRHEHHISLVFPENGHNSPEALKQLKALWPEVNFYSYSYFRQLCYLPFLMAKAKRAINLALRKHNRAFLMERALQPYGYDLSKSFVRFVKDAVRRSEPDIVQVEFYPYLGLVSVLPPEVKKIFVHHEIRYIRNARILKNLSPTTRHWTLWERLKTTEIEQLNQFDGIITLTDNDRETLSKDGVSRPLFTSPAAINTFQRSYQPWNHTVVFLGGVSHGPNVEGLIWMLKEVLPSIPSKQLSKITLKIIGKGWTTDMLPKVSGLNIVCTGFVEHLEREALGGIMVVPILSGSGMRMKILEGAALSLPMVSTTVGAEGLDFADGEACLMADSPLEFAQAMVRLFQDEELRKSIAIGASRIFETKYSRGALCSLRERIYHQICSQ